MFALRPRIVRSNTGHKVRCLSRAAWLSMDATRGELVEEPGDAGGSGSRCRAGRFGGRGRRQNWTCRSRWRR